MKHLKYTLAAAAALGAVTLASGSASAMPNGGLTSISSALSSNVESVRRVCGPVRCWWRPGWYHAYGYYGPRWRHRWWWRHHWRHW